MKIFVFTHLSKFPNFSWCVFLPYCTFFQCSILGRGISYFLQIFRNPLSDNPNSLASCVTGLDQTISYSCFRVSCCFDIILYLESLGTISLKIFQISIEVIQLYILCLLLHYTNTLNIQHALILVRSLSL